MKNINTNLYNESVSSPLYIHDNIGFVSLIDRMQNDTALKVVNSARISHANKSEKFTEKDRKLCGYLFDNDHMSPWRHTFYTFHIKAPIFTFNQWKKYQVGSLWRTYELDQETISIDVIDELYDTDKGCSWNEISGRYTELKAEFYYPKVMRANSSHNKQASLPFEDLDKGQEALDRMRGRTELLYHWYTSELRNGVAKEIARMTLPMNIYSESYWTVSLQALMHFLDQRLQKDAQTEIREYANVIYQLIKPDLDKLNIKYNTEI